MAMSEKSKVILNYLKANQGAQMTSVDISRALGGEEAGYGQKSVDGVVTALGKKNLAVRTPGVLMLDDGSAKNIKYISVTDEGMAFDPDAEPAAE